MKKLLVIFLLFIPCTLTAQIVFTDSVRYELRKYLFEHNDALDADTTDNDNLLIISLLQYVLIKKSDSISAPVDILVFKDASPHTYQHILLVVGNKSRIINMRQPYDHILSNLLSFFAKNPEIDSRLLPLFNYLIYKVFLQSTTKDQRGQWYNWWNQKDSLSQQLDVRYEDWAN